MFSKYDSKNKIWSGATIPYPFQMDFMVGDLVYQNIIKEPSKILQINEADGTKMTCQDVLINSVRIAQNLLKIGINSDDVICLFLKQSHFATYMINASIFIGAIITPLEAVLDENDIIKIMTDSKPKIIFCDADHAPKIKNILIKMKSEVPVYIKFDEDVDFPSANDFLKPTNNEKKFKVQKFLKPSDEKILAILCSSGTTGRPKGVCVSHANILAWVPMMRQPNPTLTTSLCYSPIFWGSGFFKNIVLNLSDVKIITNRKFEVENFVEICSKYQVTNFTVPPRNLAVLLNSEEFLSSNIESLKSFMVVGSILSNTLREKFTELLPNKNLNIAYGMTEGQASMTKPMEYKKEGCVGSIIFPNNKVKIVDEDGNSLDNGQIGEICIKLQFKFLGYYNNAEATKAAFDKDGFIKSGDIGYFDEAGCLYIIDRKKDILKYKGYQVNPSDVENVVQSIPGVKHVSVVGIQDELSISLLTAGVVKVKGFESLSEQDIKDYVAKTLPEYKQLHGGVYFFDELPMTLSGKIQKRFVLEAIQKLRA